MQADMNHSQEFLFGLRTAIWSTASARFNADRRLRRRDWFATFSIAMFSAVGIAIAVVQSVYSIKPGSSLDNYLTTLSVCIGLFVIVISLVEWGASNSVRASALHQNAEALNELQRKVAQALAENSDGRAFLAGEIDSFRREYEDLKERCRFNHEPIDFEVFMAEHRLSPEFSDKDGKPARSWCRAQRARLLSILSIGWYFGFFWIIILVLLWIAWAHVPS
jgi:hypothetical protein